MDKEGTLQTDILTGRPLELVEAETKAEEKDREAALLKRRAEWNRVSDTEAGQRLLALVKEKLEDRITKLVAEDPEAAAYATILKDMGVKEGMARAAMEKLTAAYLRQEKQ